MFKNLFKKLKKDSFSPIFDTMDNLFLSPIHDYEFLAREDIKYSLSFLQAYTGSPATFNAYRRDLERFLQWSERICNKSLKDIKREDIEEFIVFCQKPPKSWIGTQKAHRFISKDGERLPNPEWRPFIATVTKSAYKKGERAIIKDFEFSQTSIKEIFAILSSFYNYLIQEEYVFMNPVALIRQKSKFIRKQQGPNKIRRLSEIQWKYVINTARDLAEAKPDQHQRTLFIMSALYSMYLRISELGSSERWSPQMKHFHKESDGSWWFTTVGKGNKQRHIAVSDSMLEALKIWRTHLGLSPLPSPGDKSPLLPRVKGNGPMKGTSYIRKIVQSCFDQAIEALKKDELFEEVDSLMDATVHWLRHTGISDDVKVRPREHVRDDAGHSSSAITDKYIDIERKARHQSAKNKVIPL